jgi:putative dimethyl sulfoxide reductase chaperone
MTTNTASEDLQIQLFLSARKNLYQLIHFLFAEPTFGLLRGISGSANLDELAEFHEGGKILRDYFELLTEDKVTNEKEEYQRLFIGPGPLAAPPWESYYRSREQLLFEEWTYQVRSLYHQFGLRYIRENNEPDDHLLLELEFMCFLTDLTISESDPSKKSGYISTQIDFLEDHLTVWVPYFCKQVIEGTNSQLYLGAAMLLEDFLNYDLISLCEIREALTND